MISHNDHLEEGEEIICIGARTADGRLVNGNRYKAIKGLEEGIFAYQPYVTVIDEYGKSFSCHAARFRKLTPEDNH